MTEAASNRDAGDPADFGIDRTMQELEHVADPAVQALTRELVASVLALHAAGIGRMLAILGQAGADAGAVLHAFEQDALVRALLVLHDLSSIPQEQRVHRALGELQPYLQQTGVIAELLRIEEEAVQIRLTVPGSSCGTAAQNVRARVEMAILEAAPSAAIDVMVNTSPAGLIPVSALWSAGAQ